jgi:hypothetical protein
MISDFTKPLETIAYQYKACKKISKHEERLRTCVTVLVLAHTILGHFSERPRLLAEGKELGDTLGPTTVPQALNNRQRASKVSAGLNTFLFHTKMSVEDVAALFGLPPVDTQPMQETQGDSQPTASEAASPSSSHAHQPLSPRIQTPPLPDLPWRVRALQKHQRGPQFSQQDDGPNGSASTGPPTQTPRKGVACSTDNARTSKRSRNSDEESGSPEPDERHPESFYEGRQPLLSDAQFRQAVTEVYRDFFDNYTAHIHTNLAGPDASEMALCVLKDGLCNSMWRLLNFRGSGFTSVFGVISEKHRGTPLPGRAGRSSRRSSNTSD